MPRENPLVAEAERVTRDAQRAEFDDPALSVPRTDRYEPGTYGAALLYQRQHPEWQVPSSAAELEAFAQTIDDLAIEFPPYDGDCRAFLARAERIAEKSRQFVQAAGVIGIDQGRAGLTWMREPALSLANPTAWSATHLHHELRDRVRMLMGDGISLTAEIAAARAREGLPPLPVPPAPVTPPPAPPPPLRPRPRASTKYIVLKKLRHDGFDYAPGEPAPAGFAPALLEKLRRTGFITDAPEEMAPKKPKVSR